MLRNFFQWQRIPTSVSFIFKVFFLFSPCAFSVWVEGVRAGTFIYSQGVYGISRNCGKSFPHTQERHRHLCQECKQNPSRPLLRRQLPARNGWRWQGMWWETARKSTTILAGTPAQSMMAGKPWFFQDSSFSALKGCTWANGGLRNLVRWPVHDHIFFFHWL